MTSSSTHHHRHHCRHRHYHFLVALALATSGSGGRARASAPCLLGSCPPATSRLAGDDPAGADTACLASCTSLNVTDHECRILTGDLFIDGLAGATGPAYTDAVVFSTIEHITGYVQIQRVEAMTSLRFPRLVSIEGAYCHIWLNPLLRTVALDALIRVTNLDFRHSSTTQLIEWVAMPSLESIEYLRISPYEPQHSTVFLLPAPLLSSSIFAIAVPRLATSSPTTASPTTPQPTPDGVVLSREERGALATAALEQTQRTALNGFLVALAVLLVLAAGVVAISKWWCRDTAVEYVVVVTALLGFLDYGSDVAIVVSLWPNPLLRRYFWVGVGSLACATALNIGAALWIRDGSVAFQASLARWRSVRANRWLATVLLCGSFTKANLVSLATTGLFRENTGLFSMPWSAHLAARFRWVAIASLLVENAPQMMIVALLQHAHLGGWTSMNVASFATASVSFSLVAVTNGLALARHANDDEAVTKLTTLADGHSERPPDAADHKASAGTEAEAAPVRLFRGSSKAVAPPHAHARPTPIP